MKLSPFDSCEQSVSAFIYSGNIYTESKDLSKT